MKQKKITLTEYQVGMVALVLQEVVKQKVFENETYAIFDLNGISKAMLNDLAIELDRVRRSSKTKRGA